MKFGKPRNARRVDWRIGEDVRLLVKYYAQYVDYPEEQAVEEFLRQLAADPEFQSWVKKRRNNKRIIDELYGGAEPGTVRALRAADK